MLGGGSVHPDEGDRYLLLSLPYSWPSGKPLCLHLSPQPLPGEWFYQTWNPQLWDTSFFHM